MLMTLSAYSRALTCRCSLNNTGSKSSQDASWLCHECCLLICVPYLAIIAHRMTFGVTRGTSQSGGVGCSEAGRQTLRQTEPIPLANIRNATLPAQIEKQPDESVCTAISSGYRTVRKAHSQCFSLAQCSVVWCGVVWRGVVWCRPSHTCSHTSWPIHSSHALCRSIAQCLLAADPRICRKLPIICMVIVR